MPQHESRYDKQKPRNSRKPSYTQVEFVNIPVSRDEKPKVEKLGKWCTENTLYPLAMLSQSNYKISIKYDHEDASYCVSITGAEESPNPHLCTSSYSDDLDEAILLALYKAFNGKDWLVWDEPQKTGRWG